MNQSYQQQADVVRANCEAAIKGTQAVANLLGRLDPRALWIHSQSETTISLQVPEYLSDDAFRASICTRLAEALGTIVELETTGLYTLGWRYVEGTIGDHKVSFYAPFKAERTRILVKDEAAQNSADR